MEVREGWSTGYAKTKFDVTVTEVDLVRLLRGTGVSIEMLDSDADLAFRILQAEAMYLSAAAAIMHGITEDGKTIEHWKAEMQAARERRDQLLSQVYDSAAKPVPGE